MLELILWQMTVVAAAVQALFAGPQQPQRGFHFPEEFATADHNSSCMYVLMRSSMYISFALYLLDSSTMTT
jgi:hypothetical protein